MTTFVTYPRQQQRLRHFADQPPDTFWTALHRVADHAYYGIRRIWLGMFTRMQTALDLEAVQSALRHGGEAEIASLTSTLWFEGEVGLDRLLNEVLMTTATKAARVSTAETETVLQQLIPDAQIQVLIGPTNPTTLAYIMQQAGTEIREINATTLRNVREVVARGFAESRTVDHIARDLKTFMGLHSRQTAAIERYRAQLVAQGMKAARIDALVAKKAARALQYRVRMIARHESLKAAHTGQYMTWQSAEQQGLWDRQLRRQFVVARDERLCPSCRAVPEMNPQGVGLHEPFLTPLGPYLYPPIHVLCRCSVSLRTISE